MTESGELFNMQGFMFVKGNFFSQVPVFYRFRSDFFLSKKPMLRKSNHYLHHLDHEFHFVGVHEVFFTQKQRLKTQGKKNTRDFHS